jgi:hypothetical protein
VVVHDLNVFGSRSRPSEAHAELIVDPDAVLSGPVPLEGLQPIARRDAEIVKSARDLKLPQLAPCNSLDAREPPHSLPARESRGVGVLEGSDHGEIITRRVNNVNRYCCVAAHAIFAYTAGWYMLSSGQGGSWSSPDDEAIAAAPEAAPLAASLAPQLRDWGRGMEDGLAALLEGLDARRGK